MQEIYLFSSSHLPWFIFTFDLLVVVKCFPPLFEPSNNIDLAKPKSGARIFFPARLSGVGVPAAQLTTHVKVAPCTNARTVSSPNFFGLIGYSIAHSLVIELNTKYTEILGLYRQKIFQVHGQNRPMANLPVVDFRSQPWEILLPKPLNM